MATVLGLKMKSREIQLEIDGKPVGLDFEAQTDWTFAQLRTHAKDEEGIDEVDGTVFVATVSEKKVTVSEKQERTKKWSKYYSAETATMTRQNPDHTAGRAPEHMCTPITATRPGSPFDLEGKEYRTHWPVRQKLNVYSHIHDAMELPKHLEIIEVKIDASYEYDQPQEPSVF